MIKSIQILFLLVYCNFLYCQNTELDSVLNEYNRRYRVELNKSDTVLIQSLLGKIEEKCSLYDSLLISNKYSNAFIKELTKKVLVADFCNYNIAESISYFLPIEGDDPLSPTSFPVFSAIVENQKIRMNFKKFIISSNYMSNCLFFSERNPLFISYLSRIVFDIDSKNQVFDCQKNCKETNLQLLYLIFKNDRG